MGHYNELFFFCNRRPFINTAGPFPFESDIYRAVVSQKATRLLSGRSSPNPTFSHFLFLAGNNVEWPRYFINGNSSHDLFLLLKNSGSSRAKLLMANIDLKVFKSYYFPCSYRFELQKLFSGCFIALTSEMFTQRSS
ncbi:hypothetical protein CHUAL_014085 [Chamberlinius hualienensis]